MLCIVYKKYFNFVLVCIPVIVCNCGFLHTELILGVLHLYNALILPIVQGAG